MDDTPGRAAGVPARSGQKVQREIQANGGALARQAAGRASGRSRSGSGKPCSPGRKENSARNGSAGDAALNSPEQTGQCSFPAPETETETGSSNRLDSVNETAVR